MYAITGITGKVGGVAARALLSAGHRVRAVVRDADKGTFWSDLDCEVAIAEMYDAEALTRAFTSVTGELRALGSQCRRRSVRPSPHASSSGT